VSFSTSFSQIVQARDNEPKSDVDRLMVYAMPVKAKPLVQPTKPVSALDVWVEAHYSEFKVDDYGASEQQW
jgi:superoxide dismutase